MHWIHSIQQLISEEGKLQTLNSSLNMAIINSYNMHSSQCLCTCNECFIYCMFSYRITDFHEVYE
jgi:hypothetical protein